MIFTLGSRKEGPTIARVLKRLGCAAGQLGKNTLAIAMNPFPPHTGSTISTATAA
jgi:hypothetical protein